VLPLLLLVMSSVTSESALLSNGYTLFPKQFGLDAYQYLWFSRAQIMNAYKMTILATLAGMLSNVTITTLLAYPLSRRTLPGRNFFSFMVFFTLLFNGGMIPSYLTWTQIFHIKDTFWALIFPNLLMNGFGVIIMRTYFSTSIPGEILEAAKIDGAGETRTLASIVLPLSKPILSTIALLSGLAYWNDWLNGLYYLVKRTDFYTIQNLLNRLIASADFISNNAANSAITAGITVPSIGVRMAIAVIALIPIMILYPFLQKGFVKGIVIGSVKG
jgi:putative aldouronate transport system permease protein